MSKELSRREFLKGAAASALGAAALGTLGGMRTEAFADGEEVKVPVTLELDGQPKNYDVDVPEKDEYEADVLVIGCGFAGLNAAAAAKAAGAEVLVIDKGRPGYSGLSPWPNSHRWFDADLGDQEEAYRECIKRGSEYLGNLDAYQLWIDESKETYERLKSWGILDQYDRASDTDFWRNEDFVGYREAYAKHDRHLAFVRVLQNNGIQFLTKTMITDVITENGKAIGAIGFHVPSGKVITVHAKAVVMAMGGGAYKPTGFPVGGNTFDGEYIAYNLGLPITGKEFEDSHGSSSDFAGNAFAGSPWTSIEPIWLCGGDVTPENIVSYSTEKGNAMVTGRINNAFTGVAASDGSRFSDEANASISRRGGSVNWGVNPDDPRQGKMTDKTYSGGTAVAGAIGFGGHLSAGVLCDFEDKDGFTGIDGLYVAGDGIHASNPTGAAYPCGVGFTSNYVSIEGNRSGKAAAAYAATVELEKISAETIAEKTEEILAPMRLEKGFDPNWARDLLQGIMAPYFVFLVKNDKSLEGALTQVEYMRDHVVPKLMATSSHNLRMCTEMKHKVLSAEMKLRASLARKESRGYCYHEDYPYRDDDNFLCYITLTKGEDGSMQIGKVPVKDEWKGDLSAPYEERYQYYFYGEKEAKGIADNESATGWGNK